ncbi:hypothetical protein [Pseudomonas fluorescens]|uniref:KOW domain-containing protein n=2 Tax=Pseudomonas fluorescens TaxID=294 RepID=A0A5E7MYN1_PSEFL|nr:hypothetical protein [Pseudomonas fluorescens]VVP29851.1 hypothetical protein PS880_04282 [Pseudomonas fluorescens]
MENSKFAGNNIQLPIPRRLESLNSNDRIDVTLGSGEVVQGLFGSYTDSKLELTLVGTDNKTTIKVDEIIKLDIPELVSKAR